MNLILLGGNSIENKKWTRDMDQLLKPLFENTKTINYEHWQTDGYLINVDKEKEKLVKTANNFGRYIIFAKSAGSLVTLKAIFENKISPVKCIFVGLPIKWAKKNNFDIDIWLKNYSIPTTILQHTNDPLASSHEVQDYIKQKNVTKTELRELPGDTHDYHEFDLIFDLIKNMMEPLCSNNIL